MHNTPGSPTKSLVTVSQPDLTLAEAEAAYDAVLSGRITQGARVEQFQDMFAAYMGTKHALACSSGTTALHLALLAIDAGPGDEVIVPDLSFVATANAVAYTGATPVLCDVNRDDWGLNVAEVESLISPRTVAIIAVHLYGHACRVEELLRLANKHSLWLIEDAAEGLGGDLSPQCKLGTIGHIGTFSFYGNKVITCFPAGTSILVKPAEGRGKSRVRKIEEIGEGDFVLSYDTKTATKSYQKVVSTQKRKARAMIAVRFSNGNSLRMTPEHPVFVPGRGWVKAGKLQPGDQVVQYIYRGLKNIESPAKKSAEQKDHHSKMITAAHADGRYKTDGYANRGGAISRSLLDCDLSDTERLRRSEHMHRVLACPAARAKRRDGMREFWASEEGASRRRRQRRAMLKKAKDPAFRQLLSSGVRRAMEKESYWDAYHAGLNAKKNRSEAKLESILSAALPGEFVFNGDGSQGVRVDNLIPDFVHTGEKKKVIELFGARWHSAEEKAQKTERYAARGYESLFVWDYELTNQANVAREVKRFASNPGVKIVDVVSVVRESADEYVYNLTVENTHTYFARGILVHNCGEGGMLVTDDDHVKGRAYKFRGQGVSSARRYYHDELGYNYRMTDVQAAIGAVQMQRLDSILLGRRAVMNAYDGHLREILLDAGCLQESSYSLAGVAPWLYTILMPSAGCALDLQFLLAEAGYETRPVFVPMHELPMYASGQREFWVSTDLSRRGVSLPTHTGLTGADISTISSIVRSFFV